MENNESALHPIEILLVEDNPGDSRLAKEALKESKLKNNLYVAEDGVEAMNFLYKTGKYSKMPRPDLVILDLNLPKKDGREVLAEIKNDDNLRTYNLHANCYVTKPLDLDQFMKVVRSIEDFWLTIVKLPNGKNE